MALTQVGTDGLKDDAVTLAKQAAGTDGQVITYDASGNPKAIGPGTDGQVLTSAGAGAEPAFEDAVSEGTQVKSTGESGGTKFLREDGDGTSSWQSASDTTKVAKTGDTMSGELTIDTSATASTICQTLKAPQNDRLNVWKNNDNGGGSWYATGGASNAIDLQWSSYSAPVIKFKNAGDVEIPTGNVVIGTAGKGIDFSAQTAGTGTGQSTSVEVLKHYEEGSWTPSMDGLSNTPSFYNKVGKYTKIGSIVKCQGFIQIGATKPTFTTNANVFYISGLPFAIEAVGYGGVIGNVMWQQIDWVGASRSTYGKSDDTQITVGIESSTKCNFRTCGQSKYYMGQLKNLVFGEGDGWILEWDMTYYTSA